MGTRAINTYNAKEAYLFASALNVTRNISDVVVTVYDTGEGKYDVTFNLLYDNSKEIVNEIIEDLGLRDIDKL